MVKHESDLNATFSALSDPTRRAILARLARGQSRVGELAAAFDVSWPAVTKHVQVLQRAGLLTQDRDGRVRRCRLRAKPLRAAADWIERYRRFWTEQLDGLANFLESEDAPHLPPDKKTNHQTPRRKRGGRVPTKENRT